MKLESFRIRNYRSIIDSGWVGLSPDNITILIGQNESGKTSVLEALYSFFKGKIHEDILRSDLSLPEISCAFRVDNDFFTKYTNLEMVPPIILSNFKSDPLIYINRKWKNSLQSSIYYGNSEILEHYNDLVKKESETNKLLDQKIEKLMGEISRLTEILNKTEEDKRLQKAELDNLKSAIVKLRKTINKNRKGVKDQFIVELNLKEKKQGELEAKFSMTEANFNKHNSKLNQLIFKSDYAEKFQEAKNGFLKADSNLSSHLKIIEDLKLELYLNPGNKGSSHIRKKITDFEKNTPTYVDKYRSAKINLNFFRECAILAFSNINPKEIEEKARENYEKLEEMYTLEDLGKLLYDHLPVFKLFEDFSSLLPNRIDLEDMLRHNVNVEGFNAVSNFLLVSGLDAKFFNEQNNRILKQKIENLNGEISLHFQDYWRQKLGKSNKIKINFELEHYDFSVPSKKGKPYLEFWIKDDMERLYPKQRSRGVRWFLSFFLELKATALEEKDRKKILLIDEPGLSLHARAQEDVLKVFEDMKEDIQIIYSTHSPHLVNTDKIHRLLAVQRAKESDDRSETLIFDPQALSSASGDTLSPIYTLMGSQLSESNFLKERNNIIVEDTSAFYYLINMFRVFRPDLDVYFLPSTNPLNVPLISNLMTGWKLHYIILMSDNSDTEKVYEEISNNLFKGEKELAMKRFIITDNFPGIENLFSTIDFKKHVLQQRVGITESNLDYIKNNKLLRKDLATAFSLHCQNSRLRPSDFDEETTTNFNHLISQIEELIRN